MSLSHGKRLIACALSTVVLVTVALGQTVPNPSVKTTPDPSLMMNDTYVEHVYPPVEKPVISEQLVATCNNPSIRDNCRVYLAAYGLDDSPRNGYVGTNFGSWTDILDSTGPSTNRGVTLFELDATTCTTRNRQRFDTFGVFNDHDDRTQLLEALESAAAGTIIVGVTADSPEDGVLFQNSASSYFSRYGMNLRGLGLRDKFAFIMQKGYPKKTVFQRKSRGGTNLFMTISLSGYAVADATFRAI